MTADQPIDPVPRKLDLSPVFGQVTGLMLQSTHHKHLLLADLDWLVLPALMHGQYRLFKQDQRPVAYASWAYVGEETAALLSKPNPRLRPGDWKSGDKAWLVDLIAPFGGADKVLAELKKAVFPQRPLTLARLADDAQKMEIRTL